jgi:hypothetical protein
MQPSTFRGMRCLQIGACWFDPLTIPFQSITMGISFMRQIEQRTFSSLLQHPNPDWPAALTAIILQPLFRPQGNRPSSFPLFPPPSFPNPAPMPAEPAEPAAAAAPAPATKSKHGHAASTAQPAPRKVRFNVGEIAIASSKILSLISKTISCRHSIPSP